MPDTTCTAALSSRQTNNEPFIAEVLYWGMPSLFPGYAYDIFISYRHKDNKYDGWVTQFVQNLRKELDATLKEELSIYFDNNPHDGLLETHDVSDSLKEKLRCIIFIPILSQTYCDPNGFAWRHEFLAFNEFAAKDKYGPKVRLLGGNVTSRVLPVRIHELDADDRALFENEIGPIRSIDFIFKTPGVNRPLRLVEDNPNENQNKTYYRDQINKVANTVRDIVAAIRTPVREDASNQTGKSARKQTTTRSRLPWIVGVLVVLVVAAYFSISSFDKLSGREDIDRSIAVLPFVNVSNDTEQEYFSDGLSEEILNTLAKVKDLKVISRTSSFSFKDKNEDIRTIGNKLGVKYILEGSIRKSNNKVRIAAQLVAVDDGTNLWNETFERDFNDIFTIQDEIAGAVSKELKSRLLNSSDTHPKESKPEVYNLWLQSVYSTGLATQEGIDQGVQYARDALSIDSADARSWSALSKALYFKSGYLASLQSLNDMSAESLKAAEKAILYDPNLADAQENLAYPLLLDWKFQQALETLQRSLELEPSRSTSISMLARVKRDLGKFEESIALCDKAQQLDPLNGDAMFFKSIVLAAMGKYKEAIIGVNQGLTLRSRAGAYSILSQLTLLEGSEGSAEKALKIADTKVIDDLWKPYTRVICLWKMGRTKDSMAILDKYIRDFSDVAGFQIAEIYAFMGEREKSFEWLDRAYKVRDQGLIEIKSSFFLGVLKDDPRYNQMLLRLGLPVD